MAFSYTVATKAALKALGVSPDIDTDMRLCLDPGSNRPPSWFVYQAGTSYAELGDVILTPDDGDGNWVMCSDLLVHYDTTEPGSAPPRKNILWIASLSTPTRVTIYLSVGTSTAADWSLLDSAVIGSDIPSFTPDAVGQIFYDTAVNELYVSEGTSSSSDWIPIVGSGGGS